MKKKREECTVDYCYNPQCIWVWGNSDFPTPFSRKKRKNKWKKRKKRKLEKKMKNKKNMKKKKGMHGGLSECTVDYCCNPQCIWVWENGNFPVSFSCMYIFVFCHVAES